MKLKICRQSPIAVVWQWLSRDNSSTILGHVPLNIRWDCSQTLNIYTIKKNALYSIKSRASHMLPRFIKNHYWFKLRNNKRIVTEWDGNVKVSKRLRCYRGYGTHWIRAKSAIRSITRSEHPVCTKNVGASSFARYNIYVIQ